MKRLYYKPEGAWFGDCMPFVKDDLFYLYYLRDTRNPMPFGEPFGWDLLLTRDFITFEDRGAAIERGGNDEQDQFIFSGCVTESADGLYHSFYTGYNRDFVNTGKPSQVVMHAASRDLLKWKKSRDAMMLKPQEGYDSNDWRDPFVLWDEEQGLYLLLLGARKTNGRKLLNGCTVYFTSDDLRNWTFQGDLWAPNLFTMHEMPDLFRIGDFWYLIITEYSDKSKMVYRMAKSLAGPWLAPQDDAFDGRAYYAGRTISHTGKRFLFGWVPTKENNDDKANYQWAGTMVIHEVSQRSDGTLGVRAPSSVWQAFGTPERLADIKLSSIDSRMQASIAHRSGDLFRFEARLKFKTGTRSFALKLYEDEESGESYQFNFSVRENKFYFETSPNQPWYQNMTMGLERPATLVPEKSYTLRLIVDGAIGTLYVDDIALNVRMYRRPGEGISVSVTDGALELNAISLARSLKG
jgi:beta-fructofuranosidase